MINFGGNELLILIGIVERERYIKRIREHASNVL